MKKRLIQFHSWFVKKMTDDIFLLRDKAEEKIRKEAMSLAFRNLGLGGIKEANFHTPCPWRYEKKLKRKLLWMACFLLGKIVNRESYMLPLKTGDYVGGKFVVFHSGVLISECQKGETTTCSQAYFDPYRY